MNDAPEWIDKTPEEIEELVVDLAEKGKSPSEIGLILRDQHGIPNVQEALGKSMLEILESHDLAPDIPTELMNLIEKAVRLRNHLDKHNTDVRSQRSLDALESKIHRLSKYYRKESRLPSDWRYDPEEAALLVQG